MTRCPDRMAFAAKVLCDPTDSVTRLVMSDWYEEHGFIKESEYLRTKGHWEIRSSNARTLFWVVHGVPEKGKKAAVKIEMIPGRFRIVCGCKYSNDGAELWPCCIGPTNGIDYRFAKNRGWICTTGYRLVRLRGML